MEQKNATIGTIGAFLFEMQVENESQQSTHQSRSGEVKTIPSEPNQQGRKEKW